MNLRRNFSILVLAVFLLSSCQEASLKQTLQTGQDPIRVNPVNVQANFINQQAISPQALDVASGNLFSNGGFENGLDGWTACSDGAIKHSSDAFKGSGALEIVPNNCFYRSAEVSPNQDLVLSCYVKVTSGSEWTGMGMGFADSNWSTVGEAPTTVISGTNYARYDVKATTPANTKYASMWLYSENPAVVDNCTLMLESEPPTPPTPSGSNLLENGDFETLDGASNPTEWSQDCGGSWNVSSEYSNELNLTGGVCVDQGLSAGDVATLSGNDYTYSCYATNNGGYASMSIFFDDAVVSKEIPKGQYQLIELKGTAPQASSGFVSIYSEADLIVDDCSLTVEGMVQLPFVINESRILEKQGTYDIENDTLVLGISGDDTLGANTGKVEVYSKTATGWILNSEFFLPDAMSSDAFGTQVKIIDGVIYATTTGDVRASIQRNLIHVFRLEDGQWILTESFGDPAWREPIGGRDFFNYFYGFGAQIIVQGDTLVTTGSSNRTGAGNPPIRNWINVFNKVDSAWQFTKRIDVSFDFPWNENISVDRAAFRVGKIVLRNEQIVTEVTNVYGPNVSVIQVFNRNIGGTNNWGKTQEVDIFEFENTFTTFLTRSFAVTQNHLVVTSPVGLNIYEEQQNNWVYQGTLVSSILDLTLDSSNNSLYLTSRGTKLFVSNQVEAATPADDLIVYVIDTAPQNFENWNITNEIRLLAVASGRADRVGGYIDLQNNSNTFAVKVFQASSNDFIPRESRIFTFDLP